MRKQQVFQGEGFDKPEDRFGGALLKNSHAKRERPLESKLPIHLVLRAKKSLFRLPKFYKKVNDTVYRISKKHGVRVYDYANVGNHLHLQIKIPRRGAWAAFIRELTGRLPLLLTTKGLWEVLPFTRIVKGWKKAYMTVRRYIELNRLEAEGRINRKGQDALRNLRKTWADG